MYMEWDDYKKAGLQPAQLEQLDSYWARQGKSTSPASSYSTYTKPSPGQSVGLWGDNETPLFGDALGTESKDLINTGLAESTKDGNAGFLSGLGDTLSSKGLTEGLGNVTKGLGLAEMLIMAPKKMELYDSLIDKNKFDLASAREQLGNQRAFRSNIGAAV
jgi:hypothetical protein